MTEEGMAIFLLSINLNWYFRAHVEVTGKTDAAKVGAYGGLPDLSHFSFALTALL